VRQRRTEEPPGAGQIDVEREIPGVVVKLCERHLAGNAGVRNRDVDPPELRDALLDESVHLFRVAYVDFDDDRASPCRLDRGADGLDVVAGRRETRQAQRRPPASANTRAVAAPIPDAAPVTTATRFSSVNISPLSS